MFMHKQNERMVSFKKKMSDFMEVYLCENKPNNSVRLTTLTFLFIVKPYFL